uniref:Uncharacterized protein n=1 Tax=Anguilla anguilla TaxID=7936 RepID=A0A0E9WTT4_ANGAN
MNSIKIQCILSTKCVLITVHKRPMTNTDKYTETEIALFHGAGL